jgi:hypothetical protein
VNFFLGVVGVIQVSRIVAYNYSAKGQNAEQQLESAKDSAVAAGEGAKEEVKEIVKA